MAATGRPQRVADQLLTIPEVAERLSVSRTSVYDLIAAGRLERVDIGTGKQPRVRIKESVLAEFIEKSTVKRVRQGRAA